MIVLLTTLYFYIPCSCSPAVLSITDPFHTLEVLCNKHGKIVSITYNFNWNCGQQWYKSTMRDKIIITRLCLRCLFHFCTSYNKWDMVVLAVWPIC